MYHLFIVGGAGIGTYSFLQLALVIPMFHLLFCQTFPIHFESGWGNWFVSFKECFVAQISESSRQLVKVMHVAK